MIYFKPTQAPTQCPQQPGPSSDTTNWTDTGCPAQHSARPAANAALINMNVPSLIPVHLIRCYSKSWELIS